MKTVNHIVWHCSATKDGGFYSLESLIAAHKARGFRTVGYHWIIEPDGKVIQGRPEFMQGAHVEGHNADTVGVCIIGTQKFTKAAWESARTLAKELSGRYPRADHKGHRDFSTDLNGNGIIEPSEWIKLCPGFDVASWAKSGFVPPKAHLL